MTAVSPPPPFTDGAAVPRHGEGIPRRSDNDLVEAFRLGDAGAFEELYQRYSRTVMRRLASLCGNEAVAEELTQEAFLRAARGLEGAAATREMRFGAWVIRIGTNLGLDHIRRLRRARVLYIEEMETAGVPPPSTALGGTSSQSDVERWENADLLSGVMSRLHPRHRQVLMLREVEGLDYQAIAERMDTTLAAIETLLFRARARFRQEYAKAIAA